MNFTNLNTYNDSHERAFEALCAQLFERWLRRKYHSQIKYFATVNGAGGDGGIEAYANLMNGSVIGLQAKWFRTSLGAGQIRQIRNSINSARIIRNTIHKYVVCLPRDFQSEKIGKGKVIVDDCEEKRINSLIDEMATVHPGMELEFWNEHRIREELQYNGNEGILRFWFDKEEISIEYLKQRFELSKVGWLKERYIPSLHSQGKINEAVQDMLYSPTFRQDYSRKTDLTIIETEQTCALIDEFTNLGGDDSELKDGLGKIKLNLKKYIDQLTEVRNALEKGYDLSPTDSIEEIDIWKTKVILEKKNSPNKLKNIIPKLIHALERTHQTNLSLYGPQTAEFLAAHNYIVLGGPGTGKTHGIAKAVEQRLRQSYPAIVVRAKGTPCNNWAEILHSTLGGLTNWTDIQIFSAFEALACRADIYRAANGVEGEVTKMLICIDGIDEATDSVSWKIRINELHQWLKDFPRLRFIVTSRSYRPTNTNPCNLDFDEVNRRYDLPQDGDVPLFKLIPIYLKEYNIKYDNAPWIIEAFESALALRVFCEEYSGKDISKELKPVLFSLSALLNLKINRIEKEFFEKSTGIASKADQVIKKALLHISELLRSKSSVEHEELSEWLIKKFSGLIDRGQASTLLDTFSDHGILQRKEKMTDTLIDPSQFFYSFSFHSYNDYFIAVKATEEIIDRNLKEFPEIIKSITDWNPIRLTAISLLTDYGILIGSNGYWVKDLDEDNIRQLQFEAISNSTTEQIKRYLPELKGKFFESIYQRNLFLEYFILPNLYRRDLNLAKDFVHDLLIGMPNTFERDLVWSSPDYFNNSDGDFSVGQIIERRQLFEFHKHNELPLIIAWSFSSVENVYRERARAMLAAWALTNIDEYVLLVDLVFFCGDKQIQQDLSIIMLGIASEISKPSGHFNLLVDWVKTNIFAESKIEDIKNSIVRHCTRCVIERAHILGECLEEDLQKARPPYRVSSSLLPLDVSGDTGRRGERFPIIHDLAWYVIQKSYDGFMEYVSGRKTNSQAEEFLQRYRDVYKADIGPYEFAVSAAIAFIKKLGWDRPTGPGWTEASHGSESKHSTFEEKYTWLAVREIQGYLADRLPFCENEEEYPRILDYNLMIHIPNPLKRSASKDFSNMLVDQWYVPEDLAPTLTRSHHSLKEDIRKWVSRKQTPDFKKWAQIDNLRVRETTKSEGKWIALYIDSDLSEPNKICRASLEMICCLLEKDKFDSFIRYFKENLRELKFRFFSNLNSFTTSPRSDTYTSVKDVLWMNWMGEDYSALSIGDGENEGNYKITKTVTSIVEASHEDGELHLKMPSKFLRDQLGIVNGNTSTFLDTHGALKALFHKTGHAYKESQQFLLIDRDSFNSVIREHTLMPLWVATQLQTTTVENRKVNLEDHYQNSRFWIVWEDAYSAP